MTMIFTKITTTSIFIIIIIMKVEKDNAMDRSDVCEQAAKDAKVDIFC